MKRALPEWVWVVVIYIFAICWFFREQIAAGGGVVFGDNVDGMLILSLHQHWFTVLSGQVPWNQPPMFYPEPGVLGFTDTFFLPGMINAFWRALGLPLIYAYTATYAVLATLGFAGQYLLARRALQLSAPTAAWMGALLLVGNALHIASRGHLQLLALWLIPGLAWLGWEAARRWHAPWKAFLPWAVAVTILMGLAFWSCFYMMWFATFFAGILVVVAGILCPRTMVGWTIEAIRGWRRVATLAGLFGLALIPFLATYLPVLSALGGFTLENMLVPDARSWVSLGRENVLWGWLSDWHWERHYGVPLVTLVLFWAIWGSLGWAVVIRRQRSLPHLLGWVAASSVIAAWLILCRWGESSPWYWVAEHVPGAQAIRAPGRFLLFTWLPLTWALGLGLEAWWRTRVARGEQIRWLPAVGTVLLLGLVVAEQFNADQRCRISAQGLAELDATPPPPAEARSFLVFQGPKPLYVTGETDLSPEARGWASAVQALYLAYHWNVPTITGYSGRFPADWDFPPPEKEADLAKVASWVESHGLENVFVLNGTTGAWHPYVPQFLPLDTYAQHNLMAPGSFPRWRGQGWHTAENWGAWTSGTVTNLTFALSQPVTEDWILTADVNAYLGGKHRETSAKWFVNDQFVGGWLFDGERNHGWRDLRIPAAVLNAGGATVRLRCELSGLTSPLAAGDSPDSRLLGLGFRGLYLRAASAPTLPDGRPFGTLANVDFATAEAWASLEHRGFSGHEGWGVWTEQPIARVTIPVPAGLQGRPLKLTYRATPFVSDLHPAQALTRRLDGQEATLDDLRTEFAETIQIPAEATQDGRIELEWDIAHAHSPESLGTSRDARTLGLSLLELRLDLAGAEAE